MNINVLQVSNNIISKYKLFNKLIDNLSTRLLPVIFASACTQCVNGQSGWCSSNWTVEDASCPDGQKQRLTRWKCPNGTFTFDFSELSWACNGVVPKCTSYCP